MNSWSTIRQTGSKVRPGSCGSVIYAVAFCHSHNNLLILLNNKCNYVPGSSVSQDAVQPRCGKATMTTSRTNNNQINLDTKPWVRERESTQPSHPIVLLTLENPVSSWAKNLHFGAASRKCLCLDFLVNLIYWKISARHTSR